MAPHYTTGAGVPRSSPPEDNEAARLGSSGGFEELTRKDPQSTAVAIGQHAGLMAMNEPKELKELLARAGCHRLTVRALAGGGFMVAMTSWSRELPDAAALEDFLDRWEGRA